MKKLRKIKLDQIEELIKRKGILVFERECDVMRNDEVPALAIVILEGEAHILKSDEEFLTLSPNYAVGLDELKGSLPGGLHLRAKPDLKAIILSKLDLNEDSSIFPIIKPVLNSELTT